MLEVVIFAGGDPVPQQLVDALPSPARYLAADSGLDHALTAGIDVDVVVGDNDSVSDQSLIETSAVIERHPPDKDATDLDLAMQTAMRLDPKRITIIGGQGGRFDHLVGVLTLLGSSRWSRTNVEWVGADARLWVVRDEVTIEAHSGALVSLFAWGDDASGVTTTGLRWELSKATVPAGATLGVSNLFTGETATVEVDQGVVMAIVPLGPFDEED